MMRIRSWALCAALFNLLPTSAETMGEYTSMSKREQLRFSKVADECFDDVNRICRLPLEVQALPSTSSRRDVEGASGNSFSSSVMMSDPFPFQFVDFHRQALQDFDSFLDAFLRPPGTSEWIVVFDSTNSNQKPPCHKRLQQQVQPHIESPRVVDEHMQNVIRNIAGTVPISEIDEVAKKVQEHGNALVSNSDKVRLTEIGRRMARRLQEVTPDELLAYKSSFLPFSAKDNECLQRTYSMNMDNLKPSCARAMDQLDSFRHYEYDRKLAQQHDDSTMYRCLAILYVFGLSCMILYGTRRRRRMQREIRLRDRILATIYSTPALKREVELKLGESAGLVPPLPPHSLAKRGFYGNEFRRRMGFIRSYSLFVILLFVFAFMMAPLLVMKIAAFMSVVHFIHVAISPKDREPICTCCCCKMSTDDLKNGTYTKEQACCGCCQGTGVCSVQCASCCGPDTPDREEKSSWCCSTSADNESCANSEGDGCCCCCDCCNEKNKNDDDKKAPLLTKKKECFVAQKSVYDGSPIQVV